MWKPEIARIPSSLSEQYTVLRHGLLDILPNSRHGLDKALKMFYHVLKKLLIYSPSRDR